MKTQLLAAAAVLLIGAPAVAAVDPPAASKADAHMRSVKYDPNNPITLETTPGASLRIILAPDEEVERVIVSDEGIINPVEEAPASEQQQPSTVAASINGVAGTISNLGQNNKSNQSAVCDPNLCRDVAGTAEHPGNIIYLKPLRSLVAQPLFVNTIRHDALTGRVERVPYAFVLTSRGEGAATVADKATLWSVTLTYPDRERAEKRAAWQKAQAGRVAAWRERQSLLPPPQAAPSATDNHRYGYKGSAAVMPDDTHDDTRTTFMRFSGTRRVPNVYRILPDGKTTLAAYAAEPDATGTTLRIAGTETVWVLRDGDEAGCVIDAGPDPDGRTATTVAAVQDRPR